MADITWKQVKAFAPSLDDMDKSARDCILEMVNNELCADAFGGESSAKYKLARIYLAAHYATMSNQGEGMAGGAAGNIERERVGDIEREFGNFAGDSATLKGLEATPFGQMYLEILGTANTIGPFVL